MRTSVSDFCYGYDASVTFKGGAEGSLDGGTQACWESRSSARSSASS